MRLDGFQSLIGEYTAWLDRFDAQHRRYWENLLRDDDEAALCEAMTWQVLVEQEVDVEPNADLRGHERRPDYRCVKNRERFYVEATCIHEASLTHRTGLPTSGTHEAIPIHWQGFLYAIFAECQNKAAQCADSDAACVLAVGTFHGFGAMLSMDKLLVSQLLTGEVMIASDVDRKSGRESNAHQVTELWPAIFVKPGVNDVTAARCPISALLIGGFAISPPPIYGLLHPAPLYPFDRSLLPGIEFCRLKDGYQSGTLETEWV